MKIPKTAWLFIFSLIGLTYNLRGDAVQDQIDALSSQRLNVKISAIKYLAKSGDARAVGPLCDCLNAPEVIVRKPATEALGNLRDARAVEPLIACLKDPDPGVRKGVVEALGKLRDARAVEPCIGSLTDKDPKVRAAACEALGVLGDARAETALISCLKDKNPVTRKSAADALGKLRDARAAPWLIASLKDKDPSARAAAAGSLGQLQDERAAQPLIASLRDVDPGVRASAAEALGKSHNTQAIGSIANAMPDWGARTQINSALKMLGWDPTSESEKVYFWIGNSDGANLHGHWEKTKRVLQADLQTRDQRRILNASYTFVALGNEEVLPNLLAVIKTSSSQEMAELYFNSGNENLVSAARSAADAHKYKLSAESAKKALKWGQW